jgi:hypothetical protein
VWRWGGGVVAKAGFLPSPAGFDPPPLHYRETKRPAMLRRAFRQSRIPTSWILTRKEGGVQSKLDRMKGGTEVGLASSALARMTHRTHARRRAGPGRPTRGRDSRQFLSQKGGPQDGPKDYRTPVG